ncbi:MAG: hypothetical protein WC756_21125 [Taibaiella sp.]|jgi:hypothetical protein
MNKVTRYWVNCNEILTGNGRLTDREDFVFDDVLGQRTIFNGYHFESKDSAFRDFCIKANDKINQIIEDMETVREQL